MFIGDVGGIFNIAGGIYILLQTLEGSMEYSLPTVDVRDGLECQFLF